MSALASLNEQRRHTLACIHEVGHAIFAEHLGYEVALVANKSGDGDCAIPGLSRKHWSPVGIAGQVAEALFLGHPVERHVAAAFYGQPAAFDADGQPLNDAAFAGRY